MCTTIGFKYKEGQVFGRTLELGMVLDNKILYVPKDSEIIKVSDGYLKTKYNCIGSGFFDVASFGDGINEAGLMGSNNFFPKYASFAKEVVEDKINTTTAFAFDLLLTTCQNVNEVKSLAKKINLVEELNEEKSAANHFFFMDKNGNKVVLEPKDGKLLAYENPVGVLTNAPSFDWHLTNLQNYVNLQASNIDETSYNDFKVSKFGEGSGMLGIPGDFTPPSRFIRASYFLSKTDKNLNRDQALLQGFRILSQFDIPEGSIVDEKEKHEDQTLYTSMIDTKTFTYHIKCHNNINIQSFSLNDYSKEKEIKFIQLEKKMEL